MALLLTTLLVTLHLAAVSVASIGPLFSIWLDWRARIRGDDAAGQLGWFVARRSIQFLTVGAVLGLLQLALAALGNDEPYFRALRTIESDRWWFAAVELVFSFACLVVYLKTWNGWNRHRFLHAALALLASTNLLYHFPTLFVLAGVIAERPSLWSSQVHVPSMLLDPDVLARVFHFLLAATGATAIYVMALASRSEATRRQAIRCAQIGLATVFLQLPLGIVVLVSLPANMRERLLGNDRLATAFLSLGIVISLVLLHHLAAVALGEVERHVVRRCAALVLLVILCMIAARCRMREGIGPTERTQNPLATAIGLTPLQGRWNEEL